MARCIRTPQHQRIADGRGCKGTAGPARKTSFPGSLFLEHPKPRQAKRNRCKYGFGWPVRGCPEIRFLARRYLQPAALRLPQSPQTGIWGKRTGGTGWSGRPAAHFGIASDLSVYRWGPLPTQPTAPPFGQPEKRSDFLPPHLCRERKALHPPETEGTFCCLAKRPAPAVGQNDSRQVSHVPARMCLPRRTVYPPARPGCSFWPSGAAAKR
jgi:hypothetical protein